MIDYPVRLGKAIAGLQDARQELGHVLNRATEISDKTNESLQAIYAHMGDVIQRVNTEA